MATKKTTKKVTNRRGLFELKIQCTDTECECDGEGCEFYTYGSCDAYTDGRSLRHVDEVPQRSARCLAAEAAYKEKRAKRAK